VSEYGSVPTENPVARQSQGEAGRDTRAVNLSGTISPALYGWAALPGMVMTSSALAAMPYRPDDVD
jgi:hypothetical protein